MFPRYQSGGRAPCRKKLRGTYCYKIRKQTSLLQRFGRRVHRNHPYNGSEIFWRQEVGCHNDGLPNRYNKKKL